MNIITFYLAYFRRAIQKIIEKQEPPNRNNILENETASIELILKAHPAQGLE